MPILKVCNLNQWFGQVQAVNNLSFEVNSGEIFGVAGPNGAGKTTLFNLISGFLTGSGSIVFEGKEINKLKPHQVCQLGIARTFQIPVLFKSMNIFDNIRVGSYFGGGDKSKEIEETLKAINFVGLTGKEKNRPDTIDLLDQKKLMFACALATNPRLLLLDEPMAGLHPSEINELKDLIKRINVEKGITIIIIEHLIKKLVELSDRMMILYFGEQICIGPCEEVVCDKKVIDVYLGDESYA